MPAADLRPRAQALHLVRESVAPGDRVLITGASGWFGRTMLALLWHSHGPNWVRSHVLAGASTTRAVHVLGCGRVHVGALTSRDVADFAPTLVVNCAFPTRDRVGDLGHDRYVATARELTAKLLEWTSLPSTQRVVTLSSGAAVASPTFPDDIALNPYGCLKAEEERQLVDLAVGLGRTAQVCRVWAVSGPHVQHPRNYALSGFILDAIEHGLVKVSSPRPVIRSYVPAEDAIAVALASSQQGSGAFDTGGTPVEIGQVAAQVAQVLHVPVERSDYDPSADADVYVGRSHDWDLRVRRLGLETPPLGDQVSATIPGLMAAR